jgi:16S rRNA processing protein RimM
VSDEPDFVLIGLVRRAYGIRGEVYVEPVSDITERYQMLEDVLVRQGNEVREVGVDSVRWKGKYTVIKLHGVDDRTAAESLRGARLGVRKADVFPVPKDTYYVFDILGCTVFGESGRRVGVVDEVLRMPANDVLVLTTDNGEALIPIVKSVVKRIDLEAKTIEIEEIEGLLD